ncbi:MAG TPA: chorismate synthase [Clostridiales bacterium]|nr:chorismate synthase [Clostridiales bacterium]
MSSQWGRKLIISLFGESHGKGIGVVMDGVPPGIQLDMEFIRRQMERRSPGRNRWSTQRKEADVPEILSGVYDDHTTGTPLCMAIYNKDARSGDYKRLDETPRPGHADYTGRIRYKGFNDPRGGGHFSGRLTAPLVFAGAIAQQILAKEGIYVGAHINRIECVTDQVLNCTNISQEIIHQLKAKDFPVLDENAGEQMRRVILNAFEELDSVGGEITTFALGVPAGIGSPIFDALESKIASLVLSVPAVKGISFGSGFDLAYMRGSEANDPYRMEDGKVVTTSNHNGGILGGISNGMPIVCKVVIKPTASIASLQKTVDLSTGENTDLSVHGRHDPCIVPRAVPVMEACMALALADALLDER